MTPQWFVVEYHDWADDDASSDFLAQHLFGPFLSKEQALEWAQQAGEFWPFDVLEVTPPSHLDTASSASRQHYIDTGNYLLIGEADNWRVYENDRAALTAVA